MKVLFLQDHLAIGGAALAASRFAGALEKLGLEVIRAVGDEDTGRGHLRLTGKPARGWPRFCELFLPPKQRIRARARKVEHQWAFCLQRTRPDLVWAHHLQGGIKWGWGPRLITMALETTPVLWTLHDMWPLGDGPDYFPEEELRVRSRGSCLRQILKRGGFPAPSADHSTFPLALRSCRESCSRSMRVLALFLNPADLPRPDRIQARRALGLAPEQLFFLSCAENLADPRKGMDLLAQAWRMWNRSPLPHGPRLGLVGRNPPAEFQDVPGVVFLGSRVGWGELGPLLTAADLFLHPAAIDNYPLVVQEAQAFGTPALVFSAGGLPETVDQAKSGWVLAERSAAALASVLEKIRQNPTILGPMRNLSRQKTERESCLLRFEETWQSLLRNLRLEPAHD